MKLYIGFSRPAEYLDRTIWQLECMDPVLTKAELYPKLGAFQTSLPQLAL